VGGDGYGKARGRGEEHDEGGGRLIKPSDFGGEGSARKFPPSRASPPEPAAAAPNRPRELGESQAAKKRILGAFRGM
jgi:hypothetical protein